MAIPEDVEAAYYARLMLDGTIDEHTFIPVIRDDLDIWVLAGDAASGTRFRTVFGDDYGNVLFTRWCAWRFK